MSKIKRELYDILSYIFDPLVKYNPFFNLYYNPISNIVMRTRFNEYVNFVHQIILYTDAIVRNNIRIMIGDEVGLGKTVEAIRIMKFLVQSNVAKRILIIAPKSVVRQWIYHDLQDLFYAPGIIELISRNRISQLIQRIDKINNTDEPKIFIGSMDLVKYSEIDARGSIKFRPYYEFINSIKWDLIIIDEAHRLGFTTRSRRSLRTHRFAPLCKKTPHLLLLSATPSRGTHRDFISRLSLVLPEIEEHKQRLLHNGNLRDSFYEAINNYIFFRRTKEYVNQLEAKQIFPQLSVYLGIVRLGDYKVLYEKLDELLIRILKSIKGEANNLLKVLLIKRALSSPYAFLKTLNKVINKRAAIRKYPIEIIDPYMIDEKIERDINSILENNLHAIIYTLPHNIRKETSELLNGFEKLYKEGDPSTIGITDLLKKILEHDKTLPNELIGDILIFSEYIDTADYLYNIIINKMREKGLIDYNFRLGKIVSNLLDRICTYRPSLCRSTKRKKVFNSLMNSSTLLSHNGKYLFLLKLSSRNYELIPFVKPLIYHLKRELNNRVLCVLISTDVAGEGLNLEVFNVVINYDIPWSPIKREQRIGRIYRLRQKRKCIVIDLVRETTLEYLLYSKLLTKLHNLTEQRISSYPVEALLILKPYTSKGQVIETTGLTEVDVVYSLAEALSKIDYVDKSVIEILLDRVFKELINKVRELRKVLEDINRGLEPPERVVEMLRKIYGVAYHEEVVQVLKKLYKAIYGIYPSTNNISSILVDLTKTIGVIKKSLNNNILLMDDPNIEVGIITDVILKHNNRIIYSTPVMVIKRKSGKLEKYIGLEVLRYITDNILKDKIELLSSVEILDLSINELLNEAKQYARVIETLMRGRISHKHRKLKEMGIVNEDFIKQRSTITIDTKHYVVIIPSSSFKQPPEEEIISEEEKIELERFSTEIVISELINKGCELLEVHYQETHPYDLLVKCPEKGKYKEIMVEIKSHKKRILKGILTENETKTAEKDPWKYLICIVGGLEKPENMIIYCDYYGKIPKQFIEVKKAIVGPG